MTATSAVVSSSVLMSIAISISPIGGPLMRSLTRHRRSFVTVTANGGRTFSTGTYGNRLCPAVIAFRGMRPALSLGGASHGSSAAITWSVVQLRNPSERGRVAGQQPRGRMGPRTVTAPEDLQG
jgi:hypothetical protein